MKEPLFALLLAPFFVKSLTLVPRCGPRSLLRNRAETLAEQATFYTNLPVLDVQIMGEGGRGACWGAEGGQRKGIETETAAANLNLQVNGGTRSSSLLLLRSDHRERAAT